MIQVYKKVEKSLNNPYGVISIQSLEELNKPFLLCLSAQDNHSKSVFGMIKEGARAARVNTTDEMAAGFKINDFPVTFLGLKFEKDDTYTNNYEEIVDLWIYPFLIGDRDKKIEDIKKLARKINIMTYCDGTLTYENIEKRLVERLKNDGYSEIDIMEILSQISLIAIGTMVDTSYLKATTVSFIDVNDLEIYSQRTDEFKKLLSSRNKRSAYGTLRNSNNIVYIFEGSGNHSLKEYFLDSNIVKPVISSVLAVFLQNSVTNEDVDSLVNISAREVLNQLRIYADEEKEPILLLKALDNTLTYSSSRYTLEEAQLRYELDVAYKENQELKSGLEKVTNEKKKKDAILSLVIDKIREYCSETTFYQILVSAKMWQAPIGRDVFQEKSDKSIKYAYEQLLSDNEQNSKSDDIPKL